MVDSRRGSLTDIAARAGVSVSAVSKVRNGRTDVAPATRARIADLLRQHGYQVPALAGPGVVDLLIGGLHSPWAEELLRGAVEAGNALGAAVLVTTVTEAGDFASWVERAAARGTSGVLSVLHLPDASDLRRLARERIPLVLIDPAREPDPGIRSVGTTNWQGGISATRHLVELGHRRIAIICGQDGLWSSRARLGGYRAAMADAGLPVDEALIRHPGSDPAGGRRAAGQLLDLAEPPTAIVAGNDGQAFGVLQALGERGLRAPDYLSVTGFDDVPVASWADPPLTTIRQPLAAMAATALRMLLADPATAVGEPHHIELATKLVTRQSTAPPRTS